MTTTFKHIEAEDGLKTYVTKDYGMFIMLEDNRMINPVHVINLTSSMENDPSGLRREPIEINEKNEIIDGQHRLVAAKQLGYPIYYHIVKGLGIDDAIRKNIYRRNWTPLDFAYSYSARGREAYTRYLELHEAYPDLQHRTLMAFMQNGEQHRAGLLFKEGKFSAPDTDDQIKKRIDLYEELAKSMPRREHAGNRAFQRAVLIIISRRDYDHARMMAKMEYAAVKYLSHPFAGLEDAQRALESLYNENARDRVRFF